MLHDELQDLSDSLEQQGKDIEKDTVHLSIFKDVALGLYMHVCFRRLTCRETWTRCASSMTWIVILTRMASWITVSLMVAQVVVAQVVQTVRRTSREYGLTPIAIDHDMYELH